MRIAAIVFLALLASAPALAKESPTAEAADEVVAAVAIGDKAALQVLADRKDPDAWLVADLLCDRAAFDAASDYAALTSGPALERLKAYVAARRKKALDEGAATALQKMTEAIGAKRWQAVLDAGSGVTGPLDTIRRIRIQELRGRALRPLRKRAACHKALRDAADAARALGWLRGAYMILHRWKTIDYRRGDLRGALVAATPHVEVARALGDDRLVAATLNSLAVLHRRLGEYPRAIELYEQQLAVQKRRGDKPGIVLALNGLGVVHRLQGDWPAALGLHEQALQVARDEAHEPGIAMVLQSQANVLRKLGRRDEALRANTEATAIQKKLGNQGAVADLLLGRGNLEAELGRHAQALERFEVALALARDHGGPPGVAAILTSHAGLHLELGHFPEAIRRYEELLPVARRMGNRARVMRILSNMGRAHLEMGEVAQAIHRYEASLALARSLGAKEGSAIALASLGVVQTRAGELDRAEAHYEEALAIRAAMKDAVGAASVRSKLANLYVLQGEFDEAHELLTQSLHARRQGGRSAGISESLRKLAALQRRRGNLNEARQLFEEALAEARKGATPVGQIYSLQAIGDLHLTRGELAKADTAFASALKLLDETQLPSGYARVALGMSRLRLAQGNPAEAIRWARAGVERVARLSSGLAESEGAGTREDYSSLFRAGGTAALAAGESEALYWFLEQGRSQSLREGLGSRRALEAAVLPAALRQSLESARAQKRRALAAYRSVRARNGDRKALRAARRGLAAASEQVAQVIAGIQREAKAAAAVALSGPDALSEVQRRLAPDDAMLLFGFVGSQLATLIVRREAVRVVSVPHAFAVREAMDALLGDDEQPIAPEHVAGLRKLVIDPLKLGDDVSRVLVSPEGKLAYVPFSLLLPAKEIVYTPSATAHGLLMAHASKRGTRVLAFGDPSYGVVVDAVSRKPQAAADVRRLSRLEATRDEVKVIADVAVLGNEATETGLDAQLAKESHWKAVHFACHGLLDPDRPMLSSLALTADTESDGNLTCLEIFRRRISADLVALSACETGKGQIFLTEGVVGLTRAFMFAGAPRVLCSLWKVDDEATRALMVKFYELWNPSGGTSLNAAAALKQAQAHVRSQKRWEHPIFWAAWVLWGLPD